MLQMHETTNSRIYSDYNFNFMFSLLKWNKRLRNLYYFCMKFVQIVEERR